MHNITYFLFQEFCIWTRIRITSTFPILPLEHPKTYLGKNYKIWRLQTGRKKKQNKLLYSRDRLAQSGERLLAKPAIPVWLQVESLLGLWLLKCAASILWILNQLRKLDKPWLYTNPIEWMEYVAQSNRSFWYIFYCATLLTDSATWWCHTSNDPHTTTWDGHHMNEEHPCQQAKWRDVPHEAPSTEGQECLRI